MLLIDALAPRCPALPRLATHCHAPTRLAPRLDTLTWCHMHTRHPTVKGTGGGSRSLARRPGPRSCSTWTSGVPSATCAPAWPIPMAQSLDALPQNARRLLLLLRRRRRLHRRHAASSVGRACRRGWWVQPTQVRVPTPSRTRTCGLWTTWSLGPRQRGLTPPSSVATALMVRARAVAGPGAPAVPAAVGPRGAAACVPRTRSQLCVGLAGCHRLLQPQGLTHVPTHLIVQPTPHQQASFSSHSMPLCSKRIWGCPRACSASVSCSRLPCWKGSLLAKPERNRNQRRHRTSCNARFIFLRLGWAFLNTGPVLVCNVWTAK